jgi:hypothetical protein
MARATIIAVALAGMVLTGLGRVAAQQPMGDMPGMHHMAASRALGVKLTLANDEARHVLTVRLGPLSLPARAGMNVPQAPDQHFTIPFDGWLTAYHPRLEDPSRRTLPGRLLHHVAVFDINQSNFLCPRQPEHIFGAGGEMTDWPATPGLGYQVRRGDKVLVSTMFHNDEATSYPDTYLSIAIDYQSFDTGQQPLLGVRPVWFDVKGCGNSGYDLKPGRNVNTGEFKLEAGGRLIGVGGHMHDYGRELMLVDITRHQPIATLHAKLDPQGRLLSIPIVLFSESGGLPLPQNDVIRVTAVYDNPTGKYLPDSAMGIAVGYLVPDDKANSGIAR